MFQLILINQYFIIRLFIHFIIQLFQLILNLQTLPILILNLQILPILILKLIQLIKHLINH